MITSALCIPLLLSFWCCIEMYVCIIFFFVSSKASLWNYYPWYASPEQREGESKRRCSKHVHLKTSFPKTRTGKSKLVFRVKCVLPPKEHIALLSYVLNFVLFFCSFPSGVAVVTRGQFFVFFLMVPERVVRLGKIARKWGGTVSVRALTFFSHCAVLLIVDLVAPPDTPSRLALHYSSLQTRSWSRFITNNSALNQRRMQLKKRPCVQYFSLLSDWYMAKNAVNVLDISIFLTLPSGVI